MHSRAKHAVPPSRMTPELGIAVLRTTGWLPMVEPEFADALLANCRWHHYALGESIMVAGERTGGIFGLAAGTAGLTTSLAPADSPMTHLFHPGGWIGHAPVIAQQPRTVSATARTPAYVAYIEQRTLEALLADHPGWWRALAQHMLQAFDTAVNIAGDLMIRDSRRRLVATLLRTANARFETRSAMAINTVVTQDELAAMANLSRTTTNGLLSELETAGMIARGYERITLIDTAGLRAILDCDTGSRQG